MVRQLTRIRTTEILSFLPLRYVVQYRYRIVCVCAITVGQRPTPTRWFLYSDGVSRKLLGIHRILGWYVVTAYSANRRAAPNSPSTSFHGIFLVSLAILIRFVDCLVATDLAHDVLHHRSLSAINTATCWSAEHETSS